MEIPNIPELIDNYRLATNEPYSPTHNNASTLGRPCAREVCMMRSHPHLMTPHEASTLAKFDRGKRVERDLKTLLMQVAANGHPEVEVINTEASGRWKKYQISGKCDGILADGKTLVEIKGFTTHVWHKLQSDKDFVKYPEEPMSEEWIAKQEWYFSSLCQVIIYLLLMEKEEAIFLVVNKDSDQIRQITVKLDDWLELGELLLQRAEAINQHIEKGTLPDRIDRYGYCDKWCQFYMECEPTIYFDNKLSVVKNAELESILDFVSLADDTRKECDRANKDWKARFVLGDGENERTWLCGKHLIRAKRAGKTVRKTLESNEME